MKVQKVLIVDQLDISRKAFGKLLEKYGYEVMTIDSGEIALSLSVLFKPDIAIISCTLPDMDGFQCALDLLKIFPDLHIIFTGSGNKVNQLKISGIKTYLTNPFSGEDLLAAVRGGVVKSDYS